MRYREKFGLTYEEYLDEPLDRSVLYTAIMRAENAIASESSKRLRKLTK